LRDGVELIRRCSEWRSFRATKYGDEVAIVPLVDERNWLTALDNIPPWELPLVPTLVISPHPDDETLGAGGLIYRLRNAGIDVSVLAVTDGENAYAEVQDMAVIREEEQRRALSELGVHEDDIHRLRLPDSNLVSVERELAVEFGRRIHDGMHVVAPWERDFHPDHEACGRAARVACRSARVRLTSYVFWTWHRGTPDTFSQCELKRLRLQQADVEAKSRALLCHQSQLTRESGDPVLPNRLLAPVRRPFEVYLPT
jgi:LmbE family N-acetylglucosaminyl deacetylase